MDNEELVKKIEQTTKEVSFIRGVVITKSVDIELLIGALITNYFILSNKHSKFSEMVLSDPYFSFGLKINILKKLLNKIGWTSYKGFKEDLDKKIILQKILFILLIFIGAIILNFGL